MKKYIIENITVEEVMNSLPEHLSFDHYIRGNSNDVEVIVDDRETYLDSIGLRGETFNQEQERLANEPRQRVPALERIQIAAKISIPKQLCHGATPPISGRTIYDTSIHHYTIESVDNDVTILRVEIDMDVELPADITEEEWRNIVTFGNATCSLPITFPGCQSRNIAVFYELYNAVENVVWKLACHSDDIRLLQAFQKAHWKELISSIRLTRKSETDVLEFPYFIEPMRADGIYRPPLTLPSNTLQKCLSAPLEDFEAMCVLSDLEYFRYRLDIAIILLATMIETEAYKAELRVHSNAIKNFNPRLYFGDSNHLNASTPFYACDPDSYKDCHELWGARNEIVHFARKKIRVFDGNHEVQKTNLRDITADDIKAFRAAALKVVDWMKNL